MKNHRPLLAEHGLCAKGGKTRTVEEWKEHDAVFFPGPQQIRKRHTEAEEFCSHCPVRRQCAEEALERDIVGVVAGVYVPVDGNASEARSRLLTITETAA